MGVTLLGAVAVVSSFYHSSMQTQGLDVFPFFGVALCGSVGLLALSHAIQRIRLFDYAGRHTLTILTWHFLSFKFVTLGIILAGAAAGTALSDFPVTTLSAAPHLWLLYTAAGAGIPLLCAFAKQHLHALWRAKHSAAG